MTDVAPSAATHARYSTVTHNTLTAGPGITVQAGGLYTIIPVTLTNSVIAKNIPDQRDGC